MREDQPIHMTGKFWSSNRQTGKFEGDRDGESYSGNFIFRHDPLKRIRITAKYRPEGGFLTTPEGEAVLQTRLSADRYDWKDSVKTSISQGYCRLH